MVPFCDDVYEGTRTVSEQPELLESFKEEKIPFKDFYVFNNKRILIHPVNVNSVNIQVQNGYWETGSHSFKLFFKNLEVSDAISLALTKEILHKKRYIVNLKLPFLIRELRNNIHEVERLEKDRQSIDKLIKNPDESNFTEEVEVTKREMVDIQEPNCFSTWCNNCKVVCHYPCDIHEGNLIQKSSWWCSAMTWFNRQFSVHCTVCPKECPWRDHKQRKNKYLKLI